MAADTEPFDTEPHVEVVTVLESHIDHLTGEELGAAFDRLQEAGALDVIWLPGIMKKNRPGGVMRVVCRPEDREGVQAAFFRHTHTLGIRRMDMERVVLPRKAASLETAGERLAAKSYVLEGASYTRPEHDDLVREASRQGLGVPALRLKDGQG